MSTTARLVQHRFLMMVGLVAQFMHLLCSCLNHQLVFWLHGGSLSFLEAFALTYNVQMAMLRVPL